MLKSIDSQKRKGIFVYAGKSEALGISYRMTGEALQYLVRERELGDFTISEFNDLVIPILLHGRDENLMIFPHIYRYYIDYNPIGPRVNRLEIMLNNPKTIKNSC